MKKVVRLFLALQLIPLFVVSTATAEISVSTLFDAVVTVQTGGGQGAGVFVSENKVITAAHVVGDAKSVLLKGNAPNEFEVTGTVVFVDSRSDLAVVESSEATSVFLPIAGEQPEVSDVVYAAGSPIAATVVSRGKWLRTEKLDGRNQQVIEIAVDQGNSGGPLVNESNEVVGIILSKSSVSPVAYAATIEQISAALSGKKSTTSDVVELVKGDFPTLLLVGTVSIFLGIVLGMKFQKNRIKTIKLEI